MKQNKFFLFVIRYLGFLKSVPLLGWMYDGLMRLWTLVKHPEILDWMDEIEAEILQWPNATMHLHKYGGVQFDYGSREIGHIHSNGLLDMLLSRQMKAELKPDGRIQDHHSFKNTGWISFYIQTEEDKDYAIALMRLGYELRSRANRIKNISAPADGLAPKILC